MRTLSKVEFLAIHMPSAYFFFSVIRNLKWKLNNEHQSFSQFGEDVEMKKLLPEKNGIYLDIGAGRPIKGSNTYLFYKDGYSGTVVEPISLNSKLFFLFRNRDKRLIQLAGEKEGLEVFYEFFPYEYSTTIKVVAEELINEKRARLVSERILRVVPARSFAPQMSPHAPTLVCIDAEGLDFEILKSIDWSHTLPRVVCVENWEGEKGRSTRDFLETQGYEHHYRAGLSDIYVHRSYQKSF
jgi:hypothetical protein